MKNSKLTWSYDPALGTPHDWKRMMLQSGEFADKVALNLASNVLSADIMIVPAFRESRVWYNSDQAKT